MSARSRGFVVAALAATLALVAAPASALETDVVFDANDVAGKLDLASLRFEKASTTAPLLVVVTTHDTWTKFVLRLNVNKLIVILDVNHDGVKDYQARIRKIGDDLVAVISGGGSTFEPLPANKPSGFKVNFTIPGGSPANPNGAAPDMKAYSRFIEAQECDPASGSPACVDHAPNGGWL